MEVLQVKYVKILVWIPVILIACSIFGFSNQQGEESSGLSEKTAKIMISIADNMHLVEITQENEQSYIEKLQTPIRKTAHMTEYMILTFSVVFALWIWKLKERRLFLSSWLLVVAFASSDEFHQLFVSGRSGRATDVLIDSTGSLIGIGIIILIRHIRKGHTNKIVEK